ncbi:MAG: SIS domain-containing protein [Oscillospiraceae bacterium]
MLKFDEEKQIASVQGALALRPRIEAIVDEICEKGSATYAGWASGAPGPPASRPRVHMKERSDLELFVENAAEYLTTGSRRVGDGTIVVISSVTGSTEEMVRGVEKVKAAGARVLGFIDVETAQLAGMVDWEIAYPANEQLKFFMVADRFMYNRGSSRSTTSTTPSWMPIWPGIWWKWRRPPTPSAWSSLRSTTMTGSTTSWALATSTVPPTPTPCVTGRSSTGSAPRASTPPSSSTACWKSWIRTPR